MTRRTAIHLRLLTAVWLLVCAGCSTYEPQTAKQEESPQPKTATATLPEPAQGPGQRDILLYRSHTQDPPALRPRAEEFMRAVAQGMSPHPSGPGIAQTAAMGKKLFDEGCQDPLLRTYYGRAVFYDRGAFAAIHELVTGLNAWGQPMYPLPCRRLGVFTLFGEAKAFAGTLPWPHLREEASRLAALRVGDATTGPETPRDILRELLPLVDDDSGRNWEDGAAIYDACSKQPNADPWILHILAGRAFVSDAWHQRGIDWAEKVKPEGWRLFAENLRLAAHEYGEAMKLHPDYPEAAASMIRVAMGGGSDRTPKQWFDQAVAAQIDYMPAYGMLRWALRPRWGGSLEEMYRFGCECADTRRYDTDVPFVLLQVVNDIDEESDYKGEIWRREGVYPRLKKMLEGMANDPSRVDGSGIYPWRSSVMSLHAIVAGRAGEFAEARRLIDALGDRFDRRIVDPWSSHPEWEITNIYAFSGKGATDITKAWQTFVERQGRLPVKRSRR